MKPTKQTVTPDDEDKCQFANGAGDGLNHAKANLGDAGAQGRGQEENRPTKKRKLGPGVKLRSSLSAHRRERESVSRQLSHEINSP